MLFIMYEIMILRSYMGFHVCKHFMIYKKVEKISKKIFIKKKADLLHCLTDPITLSNARGRDLFVSMKIMK